MLDPNEIKLDNYKENYSYNYIDLDIETNGQLIQKNKKNINFNMKLSYINNLENTIEINFKDITIVTGNSLNGKIFIVKNDFKFDYFNINYDNDIDVVFKKQILYFALLPKTTQMQGFQTISLADSADSLPHHWVCICQT